jgi:small subunit ribosomal protein S15
MEITMARTINSETLKNYRKHDRDTGSIELQVAMLTEKINDLSEHFKNNSKDFSAKRGLMKLVGRRKEFLKYLERKNAEQYKELVSRLNI